METETQKIRHQTTQQLKNIWNIHKEKRTKWKQSGRNAPGG